MHNYVNPKTGRAAPLISKETYEVVMANKDVSTWPSELPNVLCQSLTFFFSPSFSAQYLNSHVIYDRDYNFNYFGFKTLERAYLLKLNGKVAERPQHMFMRVAVGIHGANLEAAIEVSPHFRSFAFSLCPTPLSTHPNVVPISYPHSLPFPQTYNLMSEGLFTHASPTLFNSGTPVPQLSRCACRLPGPSSVSASATPFFLIHRPLLHLNPIFLSATPAASC